MDFFRCLFSMLNYMATVGLYWHKIELENVTRASANMESPEFWVN